ncbi:MAG: DUF3109 family protein [Bacteroidetes bacterium]|nr:DUF3109 family protein [Bacteroidota bacterium]MCH8171166.1 DUF3109 family protein [Bacteroidota bacterium]MCH8942834.1 DUF3109 family protein [Bacteroidota bacterium]
MFVSNTILIDDIVVRDEILSQKFVCDLEKCKGACCTLKSEFGAPLLKEEIPLIEENYGEVEKYLPEKHKKAINTSGFYEEKHGELMINSVDNKSCVFVYYENDIAKCSLEKAYLEGKSSFKKPVSCQLFPIRISNFGGDVLRYEKFSECNHAEKKGSNKNTYLYEFSEEPLTSKYGSKWYLSLKEKAGK